MSTSRQQLEALFRDLDGEAVSAPSRTPVELPKSTCMPLWVDKKLIVNYSKIICEHCGQVHEATTAVYKLQLDVHNDKLRLVALLPGHNTHLPDLPIRIGVETTHVPVCHICMNDKPQFDFNRPMAEW